MVEAMEEIFHEHEADSDDPTHRRTRIVQVPANNDIRSHGSPPGRALVLGHGRRVAHNVPLRDAAENALLRFGLSPQPKFEQENNTGPQRNPGRHMDTATPSPGFAGAQPGLRPWCEPRPVLLHHAGRPLYRGRIRHLTRASGMSTEASSVENTHPFQAEVAELLRLMVHAVYSETDIFLRELISNASDACDRLRYEAIAHPDLLADEGALAIRITPDAAAGTLAVADTGIGMDREELIDNLGTVARSGTRAFISKLAEAKDGAGLIGQFGVGFY